MNDTYLVVAAGAISDTSTNGIEMIPLSIALQADSVTPDEIGSILLNFTLDLNNGELALTFDEPVDATSLNAPNVVITDSNENITITISLMVGTSASAVANVLTITLTQQDLDRVKPLTGSPVFLRLLSGAVDDVFGNPVESIPISGALAPTNISSDTTRPQLLMFYLDLTNATLTLFFDEATDLTTVDLTQFTLQNLANDIATVSYSLTGGIVYLHPTVTSALVVDLSTPDLNEIYRLQLCTGEGDCYATFMSVLVDDYAGNHVIGRTLQVNIFSPDEVTPELEEFELFDLDSGTFVLRFTEIMRASSLNITGARLQSFLENPSSVLVLSGGSTISENGLTIVVELTANDLSQLKLDDRICTAFTNCYFNMPEGTLVDMAENPVQPSITRATSFIFDTSGPELVEFSLNLNTGQMSLTFDEPVDPTTRDLSAITLQDAAEATIQYTLSGGNVDSLDPSTVLSFTLLLQDLNNIKSMDNFTKAQFNTFITIGANLIEDVYGLDNVPILDGVNATQVSVYIQDMTSPILSQFLSLDLNTDTILLQFDEPVDISTIDFSQFTLQSSETGGVTVTLVPGVAEYEAADRTTISIQLSLREHC